MQPDRIYKINGVKICAKIIPDGTRWKDDNKAKAAGFKKGSLYKKQRKLTNNTGKVLFITVHNTRGHKGIDDEGELYTRATYNENMGSARVHFYVDKNGAWQNLKAGTGMVPDDPEGSAEVSWHAGDGSVADGGNYTSLSLELIMGEDDESINDKAYDNGARLIAWLLNKHNISVDEVVSHTYWVNKKAGKIFADRDDQSTNIIYGKKWCPVYIFDSNNKSKAKQNWLQFKELIKKYLEDFQEDTPDSPDTPDDSGNSEEPKEEFSLNEIVDFVGDMHYTNSNAESGKKAKRGQAKITAIVKGKHPYHLIHTKESSSDVYGFVDKEDVKKQEKLELGDKVMLKPETNTFLSGQKVPSWLKTTPLYVRAMEADDVILTSIEQTKKVYTGRFKSNDVYKI